MANEVKANLAAQGAGALPPTTPQLELARPQHVTAPTLDILKSSDHL